jgi:cell division transport system permease protein
MVLSGWFIGDKLIAALEDEAEVSAYFTGDTDKEEALILVNQIKTMEGVRNAKYIDENEAKAQMRICWGRKQISSDYLMRIRLKPILKLTFIWIP